MYFQQAEHNSPHIHAIYGEYIGAIDIKNGKLLEGDLPLRALKLVNEWLDANIEEILKKWSVARGTVLQAT